MKEYLEDYCILLGKFMYGNVYASLLWLILTAKYLINEYNPKIIKADSCIFYKKDGNGKPEVMMSVHINNAFMTGNPETLEKMNWMINLKFIIQESEKVKKFIRVYYEWSHDAKGSYAKTTIEKGVKKLVEHYEKYTGSDFKVKKTPGDPGTTLTKSEL